MMNFMGIEPVSSWSSNHCFFVENMADKKRLKNNPPQENTEIEQIPQSTAETSSFLQYFWNLADVSEEKRVEAAKDIIQHLRKVSANTNYKNNNNELAKT